MLYRPNFNNIHIDYYKQRKLLEFMLAYGVYVIRSLNLLYVEVIANI